jgi:hypothetical protein
MPTMPGGSDDVVMLKAGRLISIDSAAVTDTDALSVTRTVKLLGPEVPVEPAIVPPAERFNPGGSDPLATVHV